MNTIDKSIIEQLQEMHMQWEQASELDRGTVHYAVIEAIADNGDGSRTVTTDHGERLVTIAANADVASFRTRNIVTLQDLGVGDAVALYYDVLTLSLPAQASTDKVVVLLQDNGVQS